VRSFRRIMVTGGCGFIGCNFIRYLFEDVKFQGIVVNVDKLTYAANPYSLADIQDRFKDRYIFIKADISEKDTMKSLFSEWKVDAICHFAAESHVDRSILGPEDFLRTNVFGTYVLLECARQLGEQFVLFHHVSTDEVFGSLDEGAFTEETPYRPSSPYSATKAASDHLVRAYNKTYGLPVTISNCSNNYGPYQFPEKLIPLMILNAKEGKELPVYGDGLNVRDWLYVKDHCEAIWLIMQKGGLGSTYNVGGGEELPNIKVVEKICDTLDEILGNRNRRQLIRFVKDRPGHDRRYAMDISKINRELGWYPKESFETGLRKTILWYLDEEEWVKRVLTKEYMSWIEKNYGGR